MKYSSNLESVLNKVREYQPVLVDMLEKYVLSEGDHFFEDAKHPEGGQVCNHKRHSLYLYKNRLELLADASTVAVVGNAVTQYTHCAWSDVHIYTTADGCDEEFRLKLVAEWVTV